MTAKDLLGVVVRTAGLAQFLFAILDVYSIALKTAGLPTSSTLPVERDVRSAVFFTVLGFFLIAGANKIVALAYWPDKDLLPHDDSAASPD